MIINLAMKRPASPLGIIRPPQMQMLQPPLSSLTDDRDSRSNSSRTVPEGTIAIDSWNDGFSMLIISLSFFCSKLTSRMNPASIIIAFLLILNLVKSFNCHLWRKLRERFTTLWNSHNSFTREERAIGAQAHSSINEGTQIKTEAPSKKARRTILGLDHLLSTKKPPGNQPRSWRKIRSIGLEIQDRRFENGLKNLQRLIITAASARSMKQLIQSKRKIQSVLKAHSLPSRYEY